MIRATAPYLPVALAMSPIVAGIAVLAFVSWLGARLMDRGGL